MLKWFGSDEAVSSGVSNKITANKRNSFKELKVFKSYLCWKDVSIPLSVSVCLYLSLSLLLCLSVNWIKSSLLALAWQIFTFICIAKTYRQAHPHTTPHHTRSYWLSLCIFVCVCVWVCVSVCMPTWTHNRRYCNTQLYHMFLFDRRNCK